MSNKETEQRLENIENLLLRLNSVMEHVHSLDHHEGENGHYYTSKTLLKRLDEDDKKN